MGPYAIGAAWYHEDFNHGQPIEEAWVNRDNARDFTSLTQYSAAVSYTHLRAHETVLDLVCRLLLEKKNYTT